MRFTRRSKSPVRPCPLWVIDVAPGVRRLRPGSPAHTVFQLARSSRPANSLSHLSRTGRIDGCGFAGATIC